MSIEEFKQEEFKSVKEFMEHKLEIDEHKFLTEYSDLKVVQVMNVLNWYEELEQENAELKDNWNKLKEWLKEGFDYERGVVSEDFIEAIENTLDKMQEIEEKNDKRNMETN